VFIHLSCMADNVNRMFAPPTRSQSYKGRKVEDFELEYA
jgi:hypothetical protein